MAAVRSANAPPHIIEQWEEEVKRRKTVDSLKVPPSLRSRLAQATADANSAMQAKERAEKGLTQAQEALTTAKSNITKAEDTLRKAAAAEEQAAAHLQKVTAEVAPATSAKPDQTEDEQTAGAALNTILTAFANASKEDASLEDKQELEAALHQAREQAKAREEANTAAGKAVEAQAMAIDRAEASKRNEPDATQLGDKDLEDDELEELLKQVPAGKRQRAQERLNQLGVADEATAAR